MSIQIQPYMYYENRTQGTQKKTCKKIKLKKIQQESANNH